MKSTARAAILEIVRSEIEQTLQIPMVYPNADERARLSGSAQAEAHKVWCSVSILTGDEYQATCGQQQVTYETAGAIIFMLCAPIDSGEGRLIEFADSIVSVFRGRSFEGVQCETPIRRSIGRRDDCWQFNVTCPLYAEETV